MSFINYLKIARILLLLNLPFGVIGTFLDIRDLSTYMILLPMTFLDFIFLSSNYTKLKFNKIEILLIVLVLCSVIIGLLNTLSLTRRHISDLTNPLFLILKIVIFRSYIFESIPFLKKFIPLLAKQLFYVGFGSILLFFVLSFYKSMYAGITPTVHPFFIDGMTKGNGLSQVASILIILLSGKRALLISSSIIFILYQILIKKKGKIILYIFVAFFSLSFLISYLGLNVEGISAFEKYKWTYELYMDNKDDLNYDSEILNTLTAGRLAEIQGATKVMSPLDYIIGKGVGFTYTYFSQSLNEDMTEYANLHFSPLGIITKYGFIFYFVFMFYIFSSLTKFSTNGYLSILFGLYIIATLIDMLFAYTIFVDPIIPIALGFLTNRKRFEYEI
jgi:hypothetical protein